MTKSASSLRPGDVILCHGLAEKIVRAERRPQGFVTLRTVHHDHIVPGDREFEMA